MGKETFMPKLTKELLDTYKTPASPETGYIKVGMNTCGISAGAQKIYDAFVHKVKEKNIPIEIKKCGCLGMCHAEPLIEVKIGGNRRFSMAASTGKKPCLFLKTKVCLSF